MRALARARNALNLVGSVLVLALATLVVLDVLGRELLGAPLPGVPEIVSLSILVIVFLQAPAALAGGRLTRTEGVVRALRARRPRAALVLECVHDVAGAAVFAIVVAGSWPLFVRAFERREFVGAIGELTVPVWPVRLVVIVGSVLLIVGFAERIAERIDRAGSRGADRRRSGRPGSGR